MTERGAFSPYSNPHMHDSQPSVDVDKQAPDSCSEKESLSSTSVPQIDKSWRRMAYSLHTTGNSLHLMGFTGGFA